jgi:mono/diheme cytochrome c family protein
MRYFFLILLIAVFLSCNNNPAANTNAKPTTAVNNSNGEALFKTNCFICHKTNADYLGPGLKGAKLRWADKDLLYEFVHNPESVIAKDGYALGLKERYGGPMTPFPNLSNNDIDAILDYCNQ